MNCLFSKNYIDTTIVNDESPINWDFFHIYAIFGIILMELWFLVYFLVIWSEQCRIIIAYKIKKFCNVS